MVCAHPVGAWSSPRQGPATGSRCRVRLPGVPSTGFALRLLSTSTLVIEGTGRTHPAGCQMVSPDRPLALPDTPLLSSRSDGLRPRVPCCPGARG
jgi:hypothetical protein